MNRVPGSTADPGTTPKGRPSSLRPLTGAGMSAAGPGRAREGTPLVRSVPHGWLHPVKAQGRGRNFRERPGPPNSPGNRATYRTNHTWPISGSGTAVRPRKPCPAWCFPAGIPGIEKRAVPRREQRTARGAMVCCQRLAP
ncbi:hypothetical protein GCM10012280_68710 [Wenjunlia tyrosinilytica]|uniref:Uncharacterized protein n=1 Tax=Wenjunlia tyrosinilytica TaxID=1544741 RepID=A0A917ZXE8_9ACTN|nr:hypothetical protein GCM10012280_68710 [Wenjunlia tyrosinilytica]